MQATVVLLVVATTLLTSVPYVNCTYGIDVSSPVSSGDFSCLKNNGIEFVIVRAYQSLGQVDSEAPQTIRNAGQAGIQYIDVYLFPCPKCSKSASQQVIDMLDYLEMSGSDYGQIWLDIEGSQYWLGNYADNQKFFEELAQTASSHKKIGVYSSAYQWSSIMGNYTGGSQYQLWYAHYDNNPSFDDFKLFGGWTKPAIKQYAGDVTECGVDVDRDYY